MKHVLTHNYAVVESGEHDLIDFPATICTDDLVEVSLFNNDTTLIQYIAKKPLELFPGLPIVGGWVERNKFYRYDDKIAWCHQAHSRMFYPIELTPALFTLIKPVGEGEWPEWVQPLGGHDSYGLGAIVQHKGKVWISLYAANSWEPGVFGWEEYFE